MVQYNTLTTRYQFQSEFLEFRAITQRIRKIQTSQQEMTQRLDLLQFQQQELMEADLSLNEENDLLDARGKLLNYKKINILKLSFLKTYK